MRILHVLLVAIVVGMVVLAGCGGGQTLAPVPPAPGGGGGSAGTMEVGPMLVRPASTTGFTVEHIDSQGECAFVAMWGAQIDYAASQAMLDRIVFASERDGYNDIWMCNIDGSGVTQITNNGATELRPEWSQDGTRITFDRQWPAQDSEIMTMDADGSSIVTLTSNTYPDAFGTWSPDDRRIAFNCRPGANWEIYAMYDDGSNPRNLSTHPSNDQYPEWSPGTANQRIAFCSDRGGDYEVYMMTTDGTAQWSVTTNTDPDFAPSWHPRGDSLAVQRIVGGDYEIFTLSDTGTDECRFSNDPYIDRVPAWSSDGQFIAFASSRTGSRDIWLQEADLPHRAYRVTDYVGEDDYPDLGSPTMQTERVLIGPPGSDWGGLDPIWASAYAAVVAFGDDGYRNFVRIGIRPADVGSLQVTPLVGSAQCGGPPVGVLVEANEIVNLREDAGRGCDPTVWQLDALDAGAVMLYFSATTGKLVSVIAVDDSAYPSGVGAMEDAVRPRVEGDRLVVEGDFSAVFDAEGRDVAPDGATRVALDRDGNATVLQ